MPEQKPKRRILVGLDASRISTELQRVATQIATFLKAELNGLFVEDINLIRLAQLPFTQEIRTLTNKPTPLTTEEIQQRLRTQATLLRHELEQAAESSNLHWTFQVVRGMVTQELLRAARGADLLILGRISQQNSLHKRVGSTALTAVRQAAGPVLIVTPEIDFFRPVLLFYDGSAAAERALHLSIALAQTSQQIQIILSGESEEEASRHKTAIEATLEGTKIYTSFYQLYPANRTLFFDIIKEVQPGIIVYGHGRDHEWPDAAEQLLNSTNHPLLIVHNQE